MPVDNNGGSDVMDMININKTRNFLETYHPTTDKDLDEDDKRYISENISSFSNLVARVKKHSFTNTYISDAASKMGVTEERTTDILRRFEIKVLKDSVDLYAKKINTDFYVFVRAEIQSCHIQDIASVCMNSNHEDKDRIIELLENGVVSPSSMWKGKHFITLAVESKNQELLECLIRKTADLISYDETGKTPLECILLDTSWLGEKENEIVANVIDLAAYQGSQVNLYSVLSSKPKIEETKGIRPLLKNQIKEVKLFYIRMNMFMSNKIFIRFMLDIKEYSHKKGIDLNHLSDECDEHTFILKKINSFMLLHTAKIKIVTFSLCDLYMKNLELKVRMPVLSLEDTYLGLQALYHLGEKNIPFTTKKVLHLKVEDDQFVEELSSDEYNELAMKNERRFLPHQETKKILNSLDSSIEKRRRRLTYSLEMAASTLRTHSLYIDKRIIQITGTNNISKQILGLLTDASSSLEAIFEIIKTRLILPINTYNLSKAHTISKDRMNAYIFSLFQKKNAIEKILENFMTDCKKHLHTEKCSLALVDHITMLTRCKESFHQLVSAFESIPSPPWESKPHHCLTASMTGVIMVTDDLSLTHKDIDIDAELLTLENYSSAQNTSDHGEHELNNLSSEFCEYFSLLLYRLSQPTLDIVSTAKQYMKEEESIHYNSAHKGIVEYKALTEEIKRIEETEEIRKDQTVITAYKELFHYSEKKIDLVGLNTEYKKMLEAIFSKKCAFSMLSTELRRQLDNNTKKKTAANVTKQTSFSSQGIDQMLSSYFSVRRRDREPHVPIERTGEVTGEKFGHVPPHFSDTSEVDMNSKESCILLAEPSPLEPDTDAHKHHSIEVINKSDLSSDTSDEPATTVSESSSHATEASQPHEQIIDKKKLNKKVRPKNKIEDFFLLSRMYEINKRRKAFNSKHEKSNKKKKPELESTHEIKLLRKNISHLSRKGFHEYCDRNASYLENKSSCMTEDTEPSLYKKVDCTVDSTNDSEPNFKYKGDYITEDTESSSKSEDDDVINVSEDSSKQLDQSSEVKIESRIKRPLPVNRRSYTIKGIEDTKKDKNKHSTDDSDRECLKVVLERKRKRKK